jgi:Lon protease-like protein
VKKIAERYRGPADLPQRIPVFPLPCAILLPRATLPLNIFEPRYLRMIEDVMATSRVLGMVQPERHADEAPVAQTVPCGGSGVPGALPRIKSSMTGACS